jgi:peptide/nickel transport system ATP-binding protein
VSEKKEVILQVKDLVKHYPVRLGFFDSIRGIKAQVVHAVDGVSFEVKRGEVFGLAGESGCGKTTVARTILMLTQPTSGSVVFEGVDLGKLKRHVLKKYRTKIQVVFQDPYESVNPRFTIFDIVAEGLFVNNLVRSREEAVSRVLAALRDVQIIPPEEFLLRYPHELSGGQRQRVAIARALVLDPDFIVTDEPVSMLDVSIRAEVLNVLLAIRQKRGISILFITHDLALAKDIVDRLAIMYLGKIVEMASAEELVLNPYHPYSQALIAAVPVPDPSGEKVRVLAKGEIPSAIDPPPACRYHTRCPFMQPICKEFEPSLEEVTQGHYVACHFWREAYEAFSKRKIKEVSEDVASTFEA